METIFRYNIVKILQEVNGEPELIPYWIKLDLLDRNVPIKIDPMNIRNKFFEVDNGEIKIKIEDGLIELLWIVNKN